MKKRDDRLYLIHVQECITRIEQFTANGEADFLADIKTQDAVLRNLHTLTESAQRISAKIKASRPDVEWRSISAFRNVVVHDYLGVDLGQIWRIVEEDLPKLKKAVNEILSAIDNG